MTFASRADAGRSLGRHLRERGVMVDGVLGLPRGGVVVAAEVARVLQRPLDVLVVRKIGHPRHREFAVGALAEGGIVILDESAINSDAGVREELDGVIREERERLREYELKFHAGARLNPAGKRLLIVDDGLATGLTAEGAVLSCRKQGAREIIVAAPVASAGAVERLKRVADTVVVMVVDVNFEAVGRYYEVFSQTSDAEVLELLGARNLPG
jgi:predicted phosphoribosyltransferase